MKKKTIEFAANVLKEIKAEVNVGVIKDYHISKLCNKEMMNHKPFGIVTDGIRDFEVAIYPDGIFILGTSNKFYTQSFYTALKEYKFTDRTPFGVKE